MEDLDKVYAKKIAEEYAPKKTSDVIRLKKLDKKVKTPANVFAYIFGIIGALIAGCGLSMILTDFGPSGILKMILGIGFSVLGGGMCGVNYPIYLGILRSRRQKYAFEITELAKEIIDK